MRGFMNALVEHYAKRGENRCHDSSILPLIFRSALNERPSEEHRDIKKTAIGLMKDVMLRLVRVICNSSWNTHVSRPKS